MTAAAQRDDLLVLSPEALIQFSNAGLVKRAVRELAGGYRPVVTITAEAALSARFADGIEVHWPVGNSLAQARCNCGAVGVCRHRLLAVLAYRDQVGEPPAPAPPLEAVADEALAAALAPAVMQEAERVRASGLRIDLRRKADGEPCDTARLPSATVRYWGGGLLAAARCDCLRGSACAHVALGVWAFRAARGAAQVQLGATLRAQSLSREPFLHAVAALLQLGVVQGSGALAQGLSHASAASQSAAWVSLLVGEIESWAAAYARRSAHYEAATGVDLLAELALRLAAGSQAVLANAVLGWDQPGETALDRLRLVSLGARIRSDGDARQAELVMADLDTGTRLLLRHTWLLPDGQEGTAAEAQSRAAQRLAPGLALDALARGQLLAQGAARRPDGSLRLARSRSSQNSVLPQAADWQLLGAPVRFDSVAALRQQASACPHAALEPRHAARRFVVFTPAPGAIEAVYAPEVQTLSAAVFDTQGQPVLLARTHERHLRCALDALAAALCGQHGAVRHVAGLLSWQGGRPCLEPWALACDHVVVPDFADHGSGALAGVPLGEVPVPPDDPCALLLARLRNQMAVLLHHGRLQQPANWHANTVALGQALEDAGLRALAELLRSCLHAPEGLPLAEAWLRLLAVWQLHCDAAEVAARQGT